MNLKSIKNVVSSKAGRQILQAQKQSPHILFGVGVVGMIGTTVLAARATLRLEETLDEVQDKLALADEVAKEHSDKYSEADKQQDKAILYARGAYSVGKLYAPAVVLGVFSVSCLAGSHNIMTKRNAGLAAAYAAVEKGFSEYRERVVSELGIEKDQEFRTGGKVEKVEQEGEDGKKKTVEVIRVDASSPSMYARFFDETNKHWEPRAASNKLYIQCQQNWANDMLVSRGHLFLNEVYDMLGMERTKAGAVVGWVLNEGGDNYVDFGVFNGNRPAARDFVNGNEDSILLDFNVDGVIYDKI